MIFSIYFSLSLLSQNKYTVFTLPVHKSAKPCYHTNEGKSLFRVIINETKNIEQRLQKAIN